MSDHFNLQCMLIHNESIPAQTLINISVTDNAFINSSFTHKHQFFTNLIHTLLDLKAFNDQNTSHITHIVTLFIFILKELTQHTLFLITNLSKQNIIFNYLWLQVYNTIIDCNQRTLLIN